MRVGKYLQLLTSGNAENRPEENNITLFPHIKGKVTGAAEFNYMVTWGQRKEIV